MQTAPASPFYKSKTFWVNVVALLSLLFPSVADWIKSNPVEFATALASLNVVIKFVTHGQSSGLVEDDDNRPGSTSNESGTSTGSGTDPCPGPVDTFRLSCIGLLALFAFGALAMSSCGYQVAADQDGLTITRDGKTVTIHRTVSKPESATTTAAPLVVIPLK